MYCVLANDLKYYANFIIARIGDIMNVNKYKYQGMEINRRNILYPHNGL